MLASLVKNISRKFAITGAISLLLIVVYITVGVVLREITGADQLPVINVTEFMLVIVVYFGLAWCQVRHQHVATEAISRKMPRAWQPGIDVFVSLAALFFTVFLLWGSITGAVQSTQMNERIYASGSLTPIWPFKIILAIGAALFIIAVLTDVIQSFRRLVASIKDRSVAHA